MPIQLVVVSVVYLLLWQGYQLRRRLGGFAQVTLLATMVSIVVIPLIVRLWDLGLLGALDYQRALLVTACFNVTAVTALVLFRLAVDGYGPRSRPVLTVLVVGFGGGGTAVLLGFSAVADGLPMLDGVGYSHWRGLVYYALLGLYYSVAMGTVGLWMVRRACAVRGELATGIGIASAGVLLIAGACALRTVPAMAALLQLPPVPRPPSDVIGRANALSTPVALLGLSYPVLVGRVRTALAWWRNRRAYARLEPLWATSREAFPEVVLPHRSNRESLAFRLRRRQIECLDGLYLLNTRCDDEPDGSRASQARCRLRGTVERFECDHLGGDRLSHLIERHRSAPRTGDPRPAVAPADHALLEGLAASVDGRPVPAR